MDSEDRQRENNLSASSEERTEQASLMESPPSPGVADSGPFDVSTLMSGTTLSIAQETRSTLEAVSARKGVVLEKCEVRAGEKEEKAREEWRVMSSKAQAAQEEADLGRYEKMFQFMRTVLMQKHLRDDFRPAEVTPGLFLGSIGAAMHRDTLRQLGVTHILTVAKDINPEYPEDFVYQVIEVRDQLSEDLSAHFDLCFKFIESAVSQGGKVLVHCFAGKSRSSTIVIGYLMTKAKMRYIEALKHVQKLRPQVQPNPGFALQLAKYERQLALLEHEVRNDRGDTL